MAQRKKKGLALDNDSFSLTSMIDIIFLLLIYFMYLPIQQEADMTVQLPIQTEPTETTTLPSEQVVLIKPDGSIFLNGSYIEDAPILKAQTENKTPPICHIPGNRPAARAAFPSGGTKKSAQPDTTDTAAYRTKPIN